jgi:hypothetical protein
MLGKKFMGGAYVYTATPPTGAEPGAGSVAASPTGAVGIPSLQAAGPA